MSRGLPPIWDNYKQLTSSEKDTLKLYMFVGGLVLLCMVLAVFN
jgi:hypothetical protein